MQLRYCLLVLFIFTLDLSASAQQSSDTTAYTSRLPDTVQHKVDSLVNDAIEQEAFPGAQLFVIKKGEVLLHKAYGYHTYDSIRKVDRNDLYDLASLTKILGPLPALMKLYETGAFDPDVPFSTYWRSWRGRKDKKHITGRELLAHRAGLLPYIVFVNDIKRGEGRFKKRFARSRFNKRFNMRAYKQLYIHPRFRKRMWRKIRRSDVNTDHVYRYSGLASLIYPQIVNQLAKQDFESFLREQFYQPLGCNTLVYNPTQKGLAHRVVPTEIDTIFRRDTVRGYVHDENAALLGGISGNAGLFGTSADVAFIMQLYLQNGTFNGQPYLKPETISEFTRQQYPDLDNRRGLGFDKPIAGNDTLDLASAYPAPSASMNSFGHTGFTGTMAWADPDNELVFVFLSNRVHPYRSQRRLYSLNVRSKLLQLFIESGE